MTPGEIHGLHKKIVDDLRAEVEQQRTRAEAAEQELREYRDYGNPKAKLAAIRAHLAGWDPMALDNWARGYDKGSAAAQVFAAAREALEP